MYKLANAFLGNGQHNREQKMRGKLDLTRLYAFVDKLSIALPLYAYTTWIDPITRMAFLDFV